MDWQWADGCGRIVAGFGNGTVHAWDLNTESFLLRTEQSDGVEVLRPYVSFQAHLQAVTGVAVCQKQPEFLTTVSHDRAVKVWDMHNVES